MPIPGQDIPEPFKAALEVLVANEQPLDGPEDLTHRTTAQIGLYAHTLVRAALPLVIDRGPELLPTSAPFAMVVL